MTLQAVGLTYGRGEHTLFEGLDLTVKAGEALRVTGKNGSGKTRLLRVLCGLADPLEGKVLWCGHDIKRERDEFHRALLYVGHASGVKDELTALENVQLSAFIAGHDCTPYQAVGALARLGLADRSHVLAKLLSQGQRQRLALARLALEPAPRCIVLDEPFNALDAPSALVLTTLLAEHLEDGALVVYTTHQEQLLTTSRTIELNLDHPVLASEAI